MVRCGLMDYDGWHALFPEPFYLSRCLHAQGGVDLSSKFAIAARPTLVRMRWNALVVTKAITEVLQNAWLASRILESKHDIRKGGLTLQQLRRLLNNTVHWEEFIYEAALGLLAHGNHLRRQAQLEAAKAVCPSPGSGSGRPVLSPDVYRGLLYDAGRSPRIAFWNTDGGRLLRCDIVSTGHRLLAHMALLQIVRCATRRAQKGALQGQRKVVHTVWTTPPQQPRPAQRLTY